MNGRWKTSYESETLSGVEEPPPSELVEKLEVLLQFEDAHEEEEEELVRRGGYVHTTITKQQCCLRCVTVSLYVWRAIVPL